MNRRAFLKSSGAMLLGAAAAPVSAAETRPNILFIMSDDLGYGHLGCYGQKHIRTPHLDRLAAEGLLCTQAYSGCALCAPARSSIMTGLHAGHTPVRGNAGGISLREEDVTVAQVLQQAGYATGLFGKWGLGDAETSGVPNKKGFDEFFGYLHQKHAHFYYTDYLWHNEEKYPLPGNRGLQRTQYTHDIFTEKAQEFIRTNADHPFFCFVSYTIPHHEWVAPDEALAQYAGTFDEEPLDYDWREGYNNPEQPKATLAAMISHMDASIGALMAELDKSGLRDNTLVVFTSDNGADSYSLPNPTFFEANGSLRGYKGELYEGGIRVPAIARWPRHIAAGSRRIMRGTLPT